ncbi:MAG: 30S ribosomal protein S6 [Patescibacteria group bacterium]|jgi:small subunit ribosomal protein S6
MTEETNNENNLQRYELVYLISNKFSEDELEPITSSVVKLIKDNGGKIILEEDWGKKKLAYPIKKFFNAYYRLVEFDLGGKELDKLDKHLRLADEILRHLIVKKKVKTEEEIEQEKKIAKKIAERQEKEEVEQEEKKEETKKDRGKASMEELDQKLDKILDETENLI